MSLPTDCVVVFFWSQLADDSDDYAAAAERMVTLARDQAGFLGIESVRGDDGIGITLSYWRDRESAEAWGRHTEHRLAQQQGRNRWYQSWHLGYARLESFRQA